MKQTESYKKKIIIIISLFLTIHDVTAFVLQASYKIICMYVCQKYCETHRLKTANPLPPSISLRCSNVIYFHCMHKKKTLFHIQDHAQTTQHFFFIYINSAILLQQGSLFFLLFLLLLFQFFTLQALY